MSAYEVRGLFICARCGYEQPVYGPIAKRVDATFVHTCPADDRTDRTAVTA